MLNMLLKFIYCFSLGFFKYWKILNLYDHVILDSAILDNVYRVGIHVIVH